MKGSTGKFGLVNEENLICSAFNVLRRRRDIVIEHPLHGNFIDVHFAVFFLQRLVFINGVTCFRVSTSRRRSRRKMRFKRRRHCYMLKRPPHCRNEISATRVIKIYRGKLEVFRQDVRLFRYFNRATSSFLVKKKLKIKVSFSRSGNGFLSIVTYCIFKQFFFVQELCNYLQR